MKESKSTLLLISNYLKLKMYKWILQCDTFPSGRISLMACPSVELVRVLMLLPVL